MASPGAPTGLAAPRGVGGTQPRGLGPRGAPEGGAVGRLDAWGLRRRGGGRCDMPYWALLCGGRYGAMGGPIDEGARSFRSPGRRLR